MPESTVPSAIAPLAGVVSVVIHVGPIRQTPGREVPHYRSGVDRIPETGGG